MLNEILFNLSVGFKACIVKRRIKTRRTVVYGIYSYRLARWVASHGLKTLYNSFHIIIGYPSPASTFLFATFFTPILQTDCTHASEQSVHRSGNDDENRYDTVITDSHYEYTKRFVAGPVDIFAEKNLPPLAII